MPRKVRYEEMLPHEFDRALERAPIAYIPFGTLEWHDPHLALGNDAVKAHELCVRAARKSGGVVVPPTYWASEGGGSRTMTIEPRGKSKGLLLSLFTAIFREAEAVGFRVIVAVPGHYGLGQVCTVKKAALDWMTKGRSVVWALAEWEVAGDIGYRGDHAGKWETSLLWSLSPELVRMELFRKSKYALRKKTPLEASRELGDKAVRLIVSRLAEKAQALLSHNSRQRQAFIRCSERYYEFLHNCMVSRDKGEAGLIWRSFRTDPYDRFRRVFLKGHYVRALKQIEKVGLKPRDLGPIP